MNLKTFQILQVLSESLPSYIATTWLGTPIEKFNNRTPYELIKLGQAERVYAEAQIYIKSYKRKKNKRSSK
jgi:hypothetical protein